MALKKVLTPILVLAAAALGPYFLFETDAGSTGKTGLGRLFGISSSSEERPEAGWLTGTQSGAGAETGFWNANGLDENASRGANDLFGIDNSQLPAIHALRDVLRFDISPTWVTQRFPRVTTVLSELQLDGLRVPLITGTAPTDLAGTLTYYFDRYQRLQRLNVHAVTGDPSRFVAELQHGYQFQQQPALGGGLYLVKWNGRPTCVVFTTPAPIIEADSPYARYNVFIELNQAGLEYGLSNEANQLLQAGRQANRWQ